MATEVSHERVSYMNMNQISLKLGSGCNDAGTDQSKSELWSPYHLVGIPSQPGYKQTVSDQPGTVVTNLPPVFGEASVVAYYRSFGTRFGTFVSTASCPNRYDATAFCDTDRA